VLACSKNHQKGTFVNDVIKSEEKRQTCLQDHMNSVMHKLVYNQKDKT